MKRLAVMASGMGSNLERLIESCRDGSLRADMALVVSNRPEARALQVAADAGIPAIALDHRDYPSRVAHERAIARELRRHGVDLVVLAGYMRLMSPFMIGFMFDPDLGHARIVNIHPADTRAYQGPDGYGWAIATRPPATAVTVHFVDEGMDSGEIIHQEPVPLDPEDTLETLTARGLATEHRVFPLAIQRVLDRLEVTTPCAAS